jgi:hypothetical protein
MKQNIELRKLRDFGQIFNDTFTFFKDNLKPLLRSLFVICGVFLLLGAVSTAATYLNMTSVFAFAPGNTYDMQEHTLTYMVSLFIMCIILVLTQACINLVTLCYISVYLQNKAQEPSIAQVWGFFKYYFWRVVGASILLGILVVIGTLFCILPGVYLGIVFSLVIPIIVMENASFGYAFNKSFTLIRDNWWSTFGVIIVISLIVGIANSIAGVPLGVIPVISKLVSNHSNSITTPLIIFFSILRNLLFVTYSLTSIAVALCYFDLTEQKEGTGLMGRIEDFGKAEPEGDAQGPEPAEEY